MFMVVFGYLNVKVELSHEKMLKLSLYDFVTG